jgi:hypothetical protein
MSGTQDEQDKAQGQQDVTSAPDQSAPLQDVDNLPEWQKAKLAEYRREAQGYRLKLEALEAQVRQQQEAELAAKGEWEKLAKQREEALAAKDRELQEIRLDAAVIAESAKAGFIDPQDATKLIDRSKIKFEDSSVTGVAEAVAELAKTKPHLLKTNTPPPAPTLPNHNPAGNQPPTGNEPPSWLGQDQQRVGRGGVVYPNKEG